MTKKTRYDLNIDIEALRQHIEDTIPKFISPNGGSLEELQKELLEIYKLMANIIDSLKENVWEKT